MVAFAKGVNCELNGAQFNEGVLYIDDKLLESKEFYNYLRSHRVASSYEVTLYGSVQIKENLISLFNKVTVPYEKSLLVNGILEFFPQEKKVIHDISAVEHMMYEFFLLKNDKFFVEPKTITSLYNAFNNFPKTKKYCK